MYVIYVIRGGYVCKGYYTCQGEMFKVLSTHIEEYTRIFKTRKSAENALDKMIGKYANVTKSEVKIIEFNC